jgi:hypothetical protein
MNKAIIVLSGSTPVQINKFIQISRKNNRVWIGNVGNYLKTFWSGVGNKNICEEGYVNRVIQKFQQDEHKHESLNSFVLILREVSEGLIEELKNGFGVFQIHVASHEENVDIEAHDLILYEDESNFECEVVKLLNVLTKENQTNNNKQMEEI